MIDSACATTHQCISKCVRFMIIKIIKVTSTVLWYTDYGLSMDWSQIEQFWKHLCVPKIIPYTEVKIIKISICMVPKSVRFNHILPFHRLCLHSSSKETKLFWTHFSRWPWVTDPNPGSCTLQSSSIYTLFKRKRNFPCCVSFEGGCTSLYIKRVSSMNAALEPLTGQRNVGVNY